MLTRLWYWMFPLVRECWVDLICPECRFAPKDVETLRQHYHREHWTPVYYRADWSIDQAWEKNR